MLDEFAHYFAKETAPAMWARIIPHSELQRWIDAGWIYTPTLCGTQTGFHSSLVYWPAVNGEAVIPSIGGRSNDEVL